MPTTYTPFSATGNGSTTQWTLPWTYLYPNEVQVYLDDVLQASTAYTLSKNTQGEGVVTFVTPPSNGVDIDILRVTDVSNPVSDFTDGSTLTANYLDQGFLQAILRLQELKEELNNLEDTVLTPIASLPSGVLNDFLVFDGSTWDNKSLNDTKTLLGITPLPTVTGSDNGSFLVVSGGSWSTVSQADVKTALGITAIETTLSGYGDVVAYDVGTSNGQIPVLTTGDALPAVSGENLTKVLKELEWMHFFESQPSGTNAHGSATIAYTAPNFVLRQLNSTEGSISGASLGSNQITLPAGKYLVEFTAPWYTEGFGITRLRNITDGTTVCSSTTQKGQGWRLYYGQTRLNLSATKVFELQSADSSNVGSGNPFGEGHPSLVNTYASVRVWKVGT